MNWNKKENARLINAFILISSKSEAERFIRDLMTEGEIEEFAKRLETAEMLVKKTSYLVIQKETGFSSTTIARVSKWLNGDLKGYKTMIDKLNH